MSRRIVFMGTPAFAVPSLLALHQAGYEFAAVVCQPDKPQGRGKKLCACPVKTAAQALGLPVLQFPCLRAPEGVAALRELAPDYFITAAFGQILSQELLDIPKLGTVNVHASLLPKYRGPAPINWCLIQGETRTGVTTMMTDAGVDTGDMLLREAIDILPGERAGALSERLSHLGASLLIRTLKDLADGTCPREKQQESQATRFPMLRREDGEIDWLDSAAEIVNRMRGLDPWPGIFTHLGEETLKIWDAEALPEKAVAAPGTVLVSNNKGGLLVATGDGILRVTQLQAAGARRQECCAYLCGHCIDEGMVLGKETNEVHG